MSPAKVITILFIILMAMAASIWMLFQNQPRLAWGDTTRRKTLLYTGEVVELYRDKKLEQTFIANYPGLSRIDILFREADGQRVNFYLKHTCHAADDIVHQAQQLPVIETLTFYSFNFPPLNDSAAQSYCLVLEAPQATAQSSVKLQLSRGDLYPSGDLTVYNPPQPAPNPTSPDTPAAPDFPYKIYLPIILNNPDPEIDYVEDIGFQLRYRGLLGPTAQVFITRLTANRPYLWGQAWFYGGLVALYIVVLGGLFVVVHSTLRIERR